jgi:hypothetical protein
MAVCRKVRVESQPQQSALIVKRIQFHNMVTQVEERPFDPPARGNDPDYADLIHYKQALAAIVRFDQNNRRGETLSNQLEPDSWQDGALPLAATQTKREHTNEEGNNPKRFHDFGF